MYKRWHSWGLKLSSLTAVHWVAPFAEQDKLALCCTGVDKCLCCKIPKLFCSASDWPNNRYQPPNWVQVRRQKLRDQSEKDGSQRSEGNKARTDLIKEICNKPRYSKNETIIIVIVIVHLRMWPFHDYGDDIQKHSYDRIENQTQSLIVHRSALWSTPP